MKLKVKYNSTTLVLSNIAENSTIPQFIDKISRELERIGIYLSDFQISLNGKSALNPPSPDTSLQDLGIVSGDVIKILTTLPTRTIERNVTSSSSGGPTHQHELGFLREKLLSMGFEAGSIEFAISNASQGTQGTPTLVDLLNILLPQNTEDDFTSGSNNNNTNSSPAKLVPGEFEIETENLNSSRSVNQQIPTENAKTTSQMILSLQKLLLDFILMTSPKTPFDLLCVFIFTVLQKNHFISSGIEHLSFISSSFLRIEFHHETINPETSIIIVFTMVSDDLVVVTACIETFTASLSLKLSNSVQPTFDTPDVNSIYIRPHHINYEVVTRLVTPLFKHLKELSGTVQAGLDKLCPDLVIKILNLLDIHSFVSLFATCRILNTFSKNPILWKNLLIRDFPHVSLHGAMNFREKYKSLYCEIKTNEREKRQHEKQLEDFSFPEYLPGHFMPHTMNPPLIRPGGILGGAYDLDPFSGGVPLNPSGFTPFGGVGGHPLRPRYDPVGPLPGMFPTPPRFGREPPDGNFMGPYL